MSNKKETIFFQNHEFIYKNWHYPPGWYWYDEEDDLYGPFLNKGHAERGLKLYLGQLRDGVSPTQLKNLKRLQKH